MTGVHSALCIRIDGNAVIAYLMVFYHNDWVRKSCVSSLPTNLVLFFFLRVGLCPPSSPFLQYHKTVKILLSLNFPPKAFADV